MIAKHDTDTLDELSRIAIKYGADKWGLHLYAPIYHRFFEHFRHGPVRLLELGVGGYAFQGQGGASLRMWSEYFPNGTIVGIDLFPKILDLPPNVTFVQGSQTDLEFLDSVWNEFGPFDIVVDDASHQAFATLVTFDHLFKKMTSGGIYVVEDLHCAFGRHFGGRLDGKGSIIQRLQELVVELHDRELYVYEPGRSPSYLGSIIASFHVYFNIVFLERGTNDYPSIFNFDLGSTHVETVMKQLSSEGNRFPSPGAIYTCSAMEFAGKCADVALRTALAGLSQYPESRLLLEAAQFLAAESNEHHLRLDLIDKLAIVSPGDLEISCLRTGCLADLGRFPEFFEEASRLPIIPALYILDRWDQGGIPPLSASQHGLRAILRLRTHEFDLSFDHARQAMSLARDEAEYRLLAVAALMRKPDYKLNEQHISMTV